MIKAAIDIGTNTAHLLIGEVASGKIEKIIYKKRFYTFLGDDGLEQISTAAIKRLLDALTYFKQVIEDFSCKHIQVIATEGLRAASNGQKIYDQIIELYGWSISIISGIKESELIYDGVLQAIDLSHDRYVIMDIGGGSVEFIVTEHGKKVFNASYPVGISRLYKKFHSNEPLQTLDIQRMVDFLDSQLLSLWDFLGADRNEYKLIGCAGTFEIFLDKNMLEDNEVSHRTVMTSKLTGLLKEVHTMNLEERHLVKDLPNERAKYIVVALLLIEYITKKLNCTSFDVCKYALKEGVLVQNF